MSTSLERIKSIDKVLGYTYWPITASVGIAALFLSLDVGMELVQNSLSIDLPDLVSDKNMENTLWVVALPTIFLTGLLLTRESVRLSNTSQNYGGMTQESIDEEMRMRARGDDLF
jgi:hypothetical protein